MDRQENLESIPQKNHISLAVAALITPTMPIKAAPESIETERAILGGVLLENAAWPKIELEPADFFLPAHQTVFLAMRDLLSAGSPVDLVILAEELSRREQLERIGGASYLSHLTDGIPRLQNIEHYVKILKEHSHRRRLIRAGAEIARRAEAGEEVESIDSQARKLLTPLVERKPAATIPGPPAEKPIPQVPEEAWCDLARRYRDAVALCTEASDNFHLAAYLAVAGGVLGRLVYYNNPKPLYPNFWVALVGKSSRARKGTTMDFAEDVSQAVNREFWWVRSVNSAQGFVKSLISLQHRQENQKTISAILRFSELRSLIDKASHEGTRDIIPELSNAFDCPPRLERNTVNETGTGAEKPTTSIIGGAAPRWIENLNIDDLEGGIGNRFWWIAGKPKKRNAFPPAPNLTLVIHDLGTVRQFWLDKAGGKAEKGTEITLDAEARVIYDAWYKGLDRYYEHDLFQVLADRMEVHCPKVAMTYAALDRRSVIETRDIRAAIAFCEFLMESLACIFSDYGWAEAARQDQEIVAYVRKHEPLGVSQRQTQMRFSKWGSEIFNKRLQWLVGDEGPIRRKKREHLNGRSGNWLTLNLEED